MTPTVDAAGLIAAFAIAGSLDLTGWGTLAFAFVLLRLLGGHARRLSPAVSDEFPLLIAAVCSA
ncbi:MAG: hypothetical protein ACRDKS_10040, partial [Actinomycetota bacterium]